MPKHSDMRYNDDVEDERKYKYHIENLKVHFITFKLISKWKEACRVRKNVLVKTCNL